MIAFVDQGRVEQGKNIHKDSVSWGYYNQDGYSYCQHKSFSVDKNIPGLTITMGDADI